MTIKEIAKLAGVSISTVSKIVNKKMKILIPNKKSGIEKIVKRN